MIKLKGELRTETNPNEVRDAGLLPAVLYGNREEIKENISFKLSKIEFEHTLDKAGKHSLIDLNIGNKNYNVLIKDVSKAPIRGTILHADFYCVNMSEEVEVKVPLIFVGETIVGKKYGGILVNHASVIKIKCLPSKLLDKIEVDLSTIKKISDLIKVSDLKHIEGVKIKEDPRKLLVNVTSIKKKIVAPAEEVDTTSKKAEVAQVKDE
ncbi:50S ribosomal protein L25 [Patescibacteria group bacterium]|nr:50S ribosomal protein L25 [Patescibacteria group bacterium]